MLIAFAAREVYWNEHAIFVSEATALQDRVKDQLEHIDADIRSMSVFMSSHGANTDLDDFRIFAENVVLNTPGVKSASYFVYVPHAERHKLETAKRATGFATFAITEWSGGAFRPASEKAQHYFSLLYHEPFEPAQAAIIGFNPLSDQDYAEALQHTVASGKTQLLPMKPFLKGIGEFWLIKPLYAGKILPTSMDDRRQLIKGVAALGIDLSTILESPETPSGFMITLRDVQPQSIASPLYPKKQENVSPSTLPVPRFVSRNSIFIGDHGYELRFGKGIPLGANNILTVMLACCLGIFITVLLKITAKNIALRNLELRQRNEVIEHQVADKTAELTESNRILKDEIEKRKRIEQSLQQAALEWSAAMDASNDAIYLLDLQRHIVYANKTFYQVTGSTPQTAIGKYVVDIVHPDGEMVPCPVCLAQEEKRDAVITMETDNPYNPAGRPIEITVKVVRDSAGQPISIFMTLHDLTHSRMDIEEKRTLEAQLRQAQKMEAIGTLAGGIAHDFNNILAAIMGFTDIAISDLPVGHPAANDLAEVLQASKRAKDLVRQILAFSRRTDQELQAVAPHTIVTEALKLMRASIPTTIEFHQHIDPNSGMILADPTQLHQIIVNLCTNAYQAMEDQGGTLEIEVVGVDLDANDVANMPDLSPGPYVKMAVSDTGAGIQDDIKERIFDPYFTTKDFGKGSGMGLAVVHGILKGSGGAILVDSQVGKGTTFAAYFPRITNNGSEKSEEETMLPTGTEHVIVVDDESSVSLMYTRALQRLGYRVTAFASSREALDFFTARPDDVDLVLTDQTMPGMTGSDLAREFMQIRPDIPVILSTGYSVAINEKAAKALGIRAFAFKPVQPKDLAILVREVLDEVS